MYQFRKRLDLTYIDASPDFAIISGLPIEQINGKTDRDMHWGRKGGTACHKTDLMALEKGFNKSTEIVHTAIGWAAVAVTKKRVNDVLDCEAVAIPHMLEPEILETFSPTSGIITPYGNEPLSITDMVILAGRLLKWDSKKFEDHFGISVRNRGYKEKALIKRFGAKDWQDLLERMTHLKVISAMLTLKEHNYLSL